MLRSATACLLLLASAPVVCLAGLAPAAGSKSAQPTKIAPEITHRAARQFALLRQNGRRRRASQKNGEQACEGQGFTRNQCTAVGCCAWDTGACWSSVGGGACLATNGGGSEGNQGLTGDCIQTRKSESVPSTGVYTVTALQTSGVPSPFTKSISAFGFGFYTGNAQNTASDNAMCALASAMAEIFPDKAADQAGQKGVLENMWNYRLAFPVMDGEVRLDHGNFPDTRSFCDAFYVLGSSANPAAGQVMEVMEHILHGVSDVGLHYQYPDDWGISTTSTLYKEMQKAITANVYDVSDYNSLKGENAYTRILLQEFAYFVISSMWDIQTEFGPNSKEFTATTPAKLESMLPGAWAMYQRTVAKVMRAPSIATLQGLKKLDSWSGGCPKTRTPGASSNTPPTAKPTIKPTNTTKPTTKAPAPAATTDTPPSTCSSLSGKGKYKKCKAAGCSFDTKTKVCTTATVTPATPTTPSGTGQCSDHSGTGKYKHCMAAGCSFSKNKTCACADKQADWCSRKLASPQALKKKCARKHVQNKCAQTCGTCTE